MIGRVSDIFFVYTAADNPVTTMMGVPKVNWLRLKAAEVANIAGASS